MSKEISSLFKPTPTHCARTSPPAFLAVRLRPNIVVPSTSSHQPYNITYKSRFTCEKPATRTANPRAHNNDLVIVENGNELISSSTQLILETQKPNNSITDKQHSKKEAQFEYDMKKYGLQDKIVHIEILNSKIAGIIGPVSPPVTTGSMFPFQRRNRSSSPSKDNPFNNCMQRSGSPTPFKVKPAISKNFVICSHDQQKDLASFYRKKTRDEIYEKQSSDSRTSTNQTEEDQKRNADEPENWMYKTWNQKGSANDLPKDDKAINAVLGFLKGA